MLQSFEKDGKISLKSEENTALEPTLVYMAREIVGNENLSKMTLRDLGIAPNRRELLRFDMRDPNEEVKIKSDFNLEQQQQIQKQKAKRTESPTYRL